MRKHHPKNERIKRRYFAYLEEAKRMAPSSVDLVAAAISLFEVSTGYKDFALFHIEQARRFKRELGEARHERTGKPLAKATIQSRLMALKAFFHWLAGEPGYKSKIRYADSEYFNPSANDSRIATAKRERPAPELAQIRHVLAQMPDQTTLQKRDRALIAFTILTGARDDAIASLAIRDLDLEARKVFQDARTVRTKNRKTFTSWFFPVGPEIETCQTISLPSSRNVANPRRPVGQSSGRRRARPRPQGLVKRRPDPPHLQSGFRGGGPALFQPALIPQNPRPAGGDDVRHAGGFQGLEPESRA